VAKIARERCSGVHNRLVAGSSPARPTMNFILVYSLLAVIIDFSENNDIRRIVMAIPNLGLRGFESDPFERVTGGPYRLSPGAARHRQTGLTDPSLVALPNNPAWKKAAADHQDYLAAQMIEDIGTAVPREDLL